MARKHDQDSGNPVRRDELRDLSEELLRAIEAEPVPEPILDLARRLAQALALPQGAEPVPPPPGAASGEGNDG